MPAVGRVGTVPNDRYASLNPGAAAAALHSFPQRYRAVFAADPTRDPEELAQHATAHGRTVRDTIAATGDALEVLGDTLAKVLIADDVALPAAAVGGEVDSPPRRGVPLRDLLERVDTHAKATARQIESATSAAFLRTGTAPNGETVSALDLARQAVRVAAENLRAIERAVRDAGVRLDEGNDEDDD